MKDLKFPKAPCDICLSRFERADKGLVISGQFNYYFITQLRACGEGWFSSLSDGMRRFVNGVTREYFLQFPENYFFDRFSKLDRVIDLNAPKHRFSKVIEIDPKVGPVLLTHNDCSPLEELPLSLAVSLTDIIHRERRKEFDSVIGKGIYFKRDSLQYIHSKLFGQEYTSGETGNV